MESRRPILSAWAKAVRRTGKAAPINRRRLSCALTVPLLTPPEISHREILPLTPTFRCLNPTNRRHTAVLAATRQLTFPCRPIRIVGFPLRPAHATAAGMIVFGGGLWIAVDRSACSDSVPFNGNVCRTAPAPSALGWGRPHDSAATFPGATSPPLAFVPHSDWRRATLAAARSHHTNLVRDIPGPPESGSHLPRCGRTGMASDRVGPRRNLYRIFRCGLGRG